MTGSTYQRRVAIIDYGMCNLGSIARAFEEIGATPVVTSDPRDIESAERLILPGVGAFGDGIANLKKIGLVSPLKEAVVEKAVPILGICLGMQLFACTGAEGGPVDGLGWIDAEVQRLVPDDDETRIPHVGWNEVIPLRDSTLLAHVRNGTDFYFVHSYHMVCSNTENIAAQTPYCGVFSSIVERDNIYGVQFHPEKSQRPGFQVLRNFLAA